MTLACLQRNEIGRDSYDARVGVSTTQLRPLRIAQIAPLIERVPPRLYGGTERIVSYLTEALVDLGHDVTLFASGDSITSARLIPCCREALRLDPAVRDPMPYYMLMLDRVRTMAGEFDLLHFHIDQFHFPIFRGMAARTLTTLHGRQDMPDLKALYDGFPEMPLVSISMAQRAPIAGANFAGQVPHGIPRDLLTAKPVARGGYLAFLGRICPEKRVDRAIAIARRAGLPLKIAAKVDRVDDTYFRSEIAPLLDQPGVEFIGEVDERQKNTFLGEARALLFPIDWPEPFGLVMIEAMACGTPVLAFRQGSVPEVIEEGITGHVVESVEEAVSSMDSLLALDRKRIRRRFEARFTADRMAREYIDIYRRLIGEGSFEMPTILRPILTNRSRSGTVRAGRSGDAAVIGIGLRSPQNGADRRRSPPTTSTSG